MNKYTRLFIDESREYIGSIRRDLIRRRSGEQVPAELADGSRLAHSIKGMALFEEQDMIASLAFLLEEGLASLAAGEGSEGVVERMLRGTELLLAMVEDVDAHGGPSAEREPDLKILLDGLEVEA